jgi:hypothetical protein
MSTDFMAARAAVIGGLSGVVSDPRTSLSSALPGAEVTALPANRPVPAESKSPAEARRCCQDLREEPGKGDRPTMATAQQPTSAQHRRVQWKPLDRALARYSTQSLLVLLHAALASPGCSRFGDHLLLLWTRVLRTPPRPGDQAGAGALPALVEAVVRAAPGRGTVTEAEPNDPRALVAFEVAGERLLVHSTTR